MAKTRIVVRFKAGPTWASGSVRDQPDWDAHADYVNDLIDRGIFVMGGPFADDSGSQSLWEGLDLDEARRIVHEDPFMTNGVFELVEIREWNIFVDELTPDAAA
jgi:uncharacterized protein YciI